MFLLSLSVFSLYSKSLEHVHFYIVLFILGHGWKQRPVFWYVDGSFNVIFLRICEGDHKIYYITSNSSLPLSLSCSDLILIKNYFLIIGKERNKNSSSSAEFDYYRLCTTIMTMRMVFVARNRIMMRK